MAENQKKQPQPERLPSAEKSISSREAKAARERMVTGKDGKPAVVRFALLVRILHGLLLVAFTLLAFTGLAQVFYDKFPGPFLLRLFGGVDNAQIIHHAFAVLLGVVALLHVLDIFETTFVRRQRPGMMLSGQDLKDAWQTIRYNLGNKQPAPKFGRYTFEQKAVYWLLALGVLTQGLTGLLTWFPVQVTEILPGGIIPLAGILHRWTAILLVVVIFIWHLYQVHVRRHNFSIFSGRMSVEEMKSDHPLELARLQAASSSLEQAREASAAGKVANVKNPAARNSTRKKKETKREGTD